MEKSKNQMKKTLETSDRIIRLNVGGNSFCTTYGTLEFSPYFKQLLNCDAEINEDVMENGELFIDRDGDMFSHVLEYLRSYDICADNLEELQNEAKFYQLNTMVESIERILQERRHASLKQYELITFEELQELSSFPSEDSGATINSFSENYELISTLKYKELQWYCSQHQKQFSRCQTTTTNHRDFRYNCGNAMAVGSTEVMLLISKKLQ